MEVGGRSTGGCYMTNRVNKIVSKALVYTDAEIVLGCSNLEKTIFSLLSWGDEGIEEQKPLKLHQATDFEWYTG